MMEQIPGKTVAEWQQYFKVRAWEAEQARKKASRKR